jgi:hypothetical protein
MEHITVANIRKLRKDGVLECVFQHNAVAKRLVLNLSAAGYQNGSPSGLFDGAKA